MEFHIFNFIKEESAKELSVLGKEKKKNKRFSYIISQLKKKGHVAETKSYHKGIFDSPYKPQVQSTFAPDVILYYLS